MGRDLHEIIADLKEASVNVTPSGESYTVSMVDSTDAAIYVAEAFQSGMEDS